MVDAIGARLSVASSQVTMNTPRDREHDAQMRMQDQVTDLTAQCGADRLNLQLGPLDRLLSQPGMLDRFVDPGLKPPQPR